MYSKTIAILTLIFGFHEFVETLDSIEEPIWNHFKSDICAISNEHWALINWFFGRVTYVEIIEIADKHSSHQFLNEILTHLTQEVASTMIVYSVEENDADEATNATDELRFEIISEKLNKTDQHWFTSVQQLFMVPPKQTRKQFRSDEPELGGIMLAPTLSSLLNYAVDAPRHLFTKSNGNYVIIIYGQTTSNDTAMAAHIMKLLWRNYRILHTFLILACDANEMIGFYDPFEVTNVTKLKPNSQDSWGAMKWTPLNYIDVENGWILSTATNFQRYPLKVAVFWRYPTMIYPGDLPDFFRTSYFAGAMKYADGYGGFDALVMGNIAKRFNFQPISMQTNSYGDHLPNNTFTGSTGDILYRRADISFNSRFIEDYDTNDIEFIYPVFFDKLCIIAPAARKIPEWSYIFRCFSIDVWITIIVVDILCAYLWYILKLVTVYFENAFGATRHGSFTMTIVKMDMFRIMHSHPTKMPKKSIERIFIASCLIANIIIAGTFQGTITGAYSTTIYEKEIDTLQQLDASDLPIISNSQSLKNLFGSDNTIVLNSLRSKYIISNFSLPVLNNSATARDMCGVERVSDAHIIIKTSYQGTDNRPLIHVVNECPRSYHLAYIVKKGSPFRMGFSRILLQFFEAGILTKWYEQIEHALIINRENRHFTLINAESSLTLIDVQTAFLVLSIGLTVSVLVLSMEILFSEPCREFVHKQLKTK